MEVEKGVPVDLTMDDEGWIKKQRRKRQKLLIIDSFLDFAKNTTLHGLRYIAEVGLSIAEKIFWIITFLISLGLCLCLIQKAWHKWQYSPVIVSFNEEMIPVSQVPFPSITICPQWKIKLNKYEYEKQYKKFYPTISDKEDNDHDHNSTDVEEKEMLEDATLICDYNTRHLLDRNISDQSLVQHIKKIVPQWHDICLRCRWRSEFFWCYTLFHQVLTHEGVCFNFNSLSFQDMFRQENLQNEYMYISPTMKMKLWDFNFGYSVQHDFVYPFRGQENGAKPDLEIVLVERPDKNDEQCNSLFNGFKIYVQHPADMPQSSLYYYATIPGQVTSLALKFSVLNTSESLQNYQPEQRQCYFTWDRQLDYFKIYTPSNCRLECLSKYTYQRCGCVWFHMPHKNSSELCTASKKYCFLKAIDEVASRSFKVDMKETCNCLPACASVEYDAEVLKRTFDFKKDYIVNRRAYDKSQSKSDNFDNLLKANISKIDIYFKKPRYVSMRRSELYGVTEFLANCGGLLGLFLGFSFLSLIEIFYFCTLRLWCTLIKDLKIEKKKLQKSTENK